MSTITAYQLASVGVQLGSPSIPPDQAVSPAAADAVAERLFPNPVLETVLAQCKMMDSQPVTSEPCWAVSVQPPAGNEYDLWGPSATYDNSHPTPPPTFQLVLVDAESGALITGVQAGTPASPPSGP